MGAKPSTIRLTKPDRLPKHQRAGTIIIGKKHYPIPINGELRIGSFFDADILANSTKETLIKHQLGKGFEIFISKGEFLTEEELSQETDFSYSQSFTLPLKVGKLEIKIESTKFTRHCHYSLPLIQYPPHPVLSSTLTSEENNIVETIYNNYRETAMVKKTESYVSRTGKSAVLTALSAALIVFLAIHQEELAFLLVSLLPLLVSVRQSIKAFKESNKLINYPIHPLLTTEQIIAGSRQKLLGKTEDNVLIALLKKTDPGFRSALLQDLAQGNQEKWSRVSNQVNTPQSIQGVELKFFSLTKAPPEKDQPNWFFPDN